MSDGPEIGDIEMRMVPRMRVARCYWHGPAGELGPALQRVQDAARLRGVGPVGVAMAIFPEQVVACIDSDGNVLIPSLHAELRVPVSNTAALVPGETDEPDIEFVRVDRFRAACRLYSGHVNVSLREAQEEIFTWMDAAGLPRHGTRHHHAYMPNVHPGEITLELRVPVAKEGQDATG